ncbi:MAG: LPS export ABC transporter periplasmic protein LptC [Candidatus Thioglobus sp.]|uniref:LPS export ABC transporter periplasmic protein LptC n=1 Tax=Candidatus Thioglobus sp. TaxID=2026721 RepID=UPI002635A317|nr:LPS export ABC transporter periplasmic protein LptC [Candidatus Thioglobus sp.]MDC9726516.1 LPS export ABC transporter periplasmic protein LptC [Candidatus Thioglobus sp.]
MNFQLRYNLLITIFIIVTIAAMWLLMKGLSYAYEQLTRQEVAPPTDNEVVSQEMAYVEKIDQFALQEFGENQRLSHYVEAQVYYNFEQSPALLINPKVTTYDLQGESNYVLSAKRANYLDSGEVRFTGQVDVSSSDGMTHKMNTEELLVDTHTDDLVSHKKVTYLGENANIVSQGMQMKTKDNKMKLTGDTRINQDSGQKLLTQDLYIDQSNDQKHYYSDNQTTYLSTASKIIAQGMDMDMKSELTQLLGDVDILQASGSTIKSHDLLIDQAQGREIYKTDDKIHYQSSVADIRATGMYYDATRQKITFKGGVVGRYE